MVHNWVMQQPGSKARRWQQVKASLVYMANSKTVSGKTRTVRVSGEGCHRNTILSSGSPPPTVPLIRKEKQQLAQHRAAFNRLHLAWESQLAATDSVRSHTARGPQ